MKWCRDFRADVRHRLSEPGLADRLKGQGAVDRTQHLAHEHPKPMFSLDFLCEKLFF